MLPRIFDPRAHAKEDIEVTDIGDYPNHEPTFQDPYNAAGNINTANSYSYDALGNLTKDATAGISAIDWTVAGKVKAVHRAGGSPLLKLGFGYGASGQRIMKQVGEPGTDAGAYREHYIRDAQGNIMATYRYTISSAASLEMADRPIYGSARLGSYARPMELYNAAALLSNPPPSNIILKPHLRYELSDHLGNVTTTITGRLIASASSAPYEADLVSAQALEPFGSILPSGNYNAANNLRLFQGQVRDDEIYGNVGLSYAFEYRMHDARVGRFWSVDPLTAKYPHNSPYAFSENRVIDRVELEGAEAELPPYLRLEMCTSACTTATYSTTERMAVQSMIATIKANPLTFSASQRQSSIGQGGLLNSPQYKFQEFQLDNVVVPVLPFGSVFVKLRTGEEVTNTDLGIESAGVLPFGIIFTRAFKIVAKSPLAEGAAKEFHNFIRTVDGSSDDFIVSRLEKAAKKYDRNVQLHLGYINDPRSVVGDKWDTYSDRDRAGLIDFWQKEADQYAAKRDLFKGVADEAKKEIAK